VIAVILEQVVLALFHPQRSTALLVHGLAQEAARPIDARRIEGAAAQGELLQAAALLAMVVFMLRVHEGGWCGDDGGRCKGQYSQCSSIHNTFTT
jgi:hypothetical protein